MEIAKSVYIYGIRKIRICLRIATFQQTDLNIFISTELQGEMKEDNFIHFYTHWKIQPLIFTDIVITYCLLHFANAYICATCETIS